MTDKQDIVERLRFHGKWADEKLDFPFAEAADEILALRAQLTEARDAFRKYGGHDEETCGASFFAECTCGFSAALAKLGDAPLPSIAGEE